MRELDLRRGGRGTLHCYDAGPTGRDDELVLLWHGGTPNTGEPPEPLLAVATRLGIRFVGADRPGYGGTTRDPGADVADAAGDAAALMAAIGVDRFATIGHSGGGPRALACAALLPDAVLAVATVSAPAPWDAPGLDRFAGMAAGVAREQAAAAAGRDQLLALLTADGPDGSDGSDGPDASAFTAADEAALEGDWGWFVHVVRGATRPGPDAQADDLLALGRPWGYDLSAIAAPVEIVHGDADRVVPASHAAWLAAHVPGAALTVVPGAGHISILRSADGVLSRLREASRRT